MLLNPSSPTDSVPRIPGHFSSLALRAPVNRDRPCGSLASQSVSRVDAIGCGGGWGWRRGGCLWRWRWTLLKLTLLTFRAGRVLFGWSSSFACGESCVFDLDAMLCDGVLRVFSVTACSRGLKFRMVSIELTSTHESSSRIFGLPFDFSSCLSSDGAHLKSRCENLFNLRSASEKPRTGGQK